MHFSKISLFTISVVIGLSGCGGGGSSGGTTGTEGIPLTVLSMSPEVNATWVAIDANISATFSETISTDTVSTSSFELQDESNSSVSGTITVDGAKATFDPDGNLSFGTKYTGILTTQITDTQGNPLAQTYRWSFTTRSAPFVFKTGQTKSYDENGSEVLDGSVKDDGYYQKGIDHNFTRDDVNEIVTDHVTGLMWQDNVEMIVVQKPWLNDANYLECENNTSSSACYDTSGDTAASYCENLLLGGYGDWRLPTMVELQSILDYESTAGVYDETFQYQGGYWTNVTGAEYHNYAWFIGNNARQYAYPKSEPYPVRCVRYGG